MKNTSYGTTYIILTACIPSMKQSIVGWSMKSNSALREAQGRRKI